MPGFAIVPSGATLSATMRHLGPPERASADATGPNRESTQCTFIAGQTTADVIARGTFFVSSLLPSPSRFRCRAERGALSRMACAPVEGLGLGVAPPLALAQRGEVVERGVEIGVIRA